MSTTPHLFDIPKRFSLSAQTVVAIRKAIKKGTWEEFLPSERRLCELFQVSRPTIRTALHLLAKEGLIEIKQGRRNRLRANPPAPSGLRSRVVGLVTHEPVTHMSLTKYQSISETRTLLAEHGFSTEMLVCPPRSARVQRWKLEEFVRQNRVVCCVLLSVSIDLQKWFSEHSVPAMVVGSCHPQIRLPSLDVDYRSVCRHAAGVFLGKGHRTIALIVPDSGVAGDLASEQGFTDAVEHRPLYDTRALIVRHNGTAKNIGMKLDALFNCSTAPTALLIAKPQYVFIVILYLLKRGLTVPNTVSIISRDYDHIFTTVLPPIAHYGYANETFARRLSRLVLQMVSQGHLKPEPILIFPKFFPGSTIKGKDLRVDARTNPKGSARTDF
mgnify:CR=1 FL=1